MYKKVNDFRNKTKEEVLNLYKKILIKDQLVYQIWKVTKNFQEAMNIYETIMKNKVNGEK